MSGLQNNVVYRCTCLPAKAGHPLVLLQQLRTFILVAGRNLIIANLVLMFSIDLIKTNGYFRLQIFALTCKLRKYKRKPPFIDTS